MYDFSLKNSKDAVIDLVNNSYFDLVKIDGLTEYKKVSYSSSSPFIPGSIVYGDHVDPRDISIFIKPKFTDKTSVEICFRYISEFLAGSKSIKLIWKKNNLYNCEIEGIVESISSNRFTKDVQCKISLNCPYPFFKNTIVRRSYIYPGDEEAEVDPCSYLGDDPIGGTFSLLFRGSIDSLTIFNDTTNEHLTVNDIVGRSIGSSGWDMVNICTEYRKESIDMNTQTDLISNFDFTSDWIKIIPGDNYFHFEIESSLEYELFRRYIYFDYYEVFI